MLFQILQLIVSTVASILGGVMLLRFWMQAIRIRPPNQVGHVIFTLSDWLVRPMRRLVPGVGGYDWGSLIGALLVVALATTVYLLVGFSPEWYAMKVLYRFITWILYGFMALMIVEAIFSWVNPHAPMAPFVRALNEPLLRHLRRIVPAFGGLDWSMLVALLIIQIVHMVVASLFPLSVVGS
jgi:YggT family protein